MNNSGRFSFSLLFDPKGYRTLLTLGVLLVLFLAVRGGFEHSVRWTHQIAWGFIVLGVFGWMGSQHGSNPNPWRGAGICLLVYVLLASFFLYPLLTSDGDFYYGLTRSMLWNRDLNTMEEGARFSNSWMIQRAAEGSAYGFPYHPFPIGVSLLWIPFVGLGHLEALVFGFFDPALPLNGYSESYLHWLSIGTATLGAGFVLFGYLLLRLRFDHNVSSRAIIGTLIATPGLFYCFRDMGFPHAASMASIALFLWLFLRAPHRMDWKQIFFLSIPLALATLIRWQNCLFAAAPVLYWLWLTLDAQKSSPTLSKTMGRITGLGSLCFLLCFPQLLLFRLRGPDWLSLQHGGPQDFSWGTPKLYSLLLDNRYGLIPWHPFFLLCGLGAILYLTKGVSRRLLFWAVWFVGLVLSARFTQRYALVLPVTLGLAILPLVIVWMRQGNPRISRPLSLVFLCAGIEVYVNASYLLYHGGGDYGNRLVCDLIAFAALGFAYLLRWSSQHSVRWIVSIAFTSCFGWSLALLWREVPKLTRSPKNLTELLSHTTPLASMVQGIGHWDWIFFLSGLWRILGLALCIGFLLSMVLILRGHWTHHRRGPFHIVIGTLLIPISVSLWMFTDFRRVDATLFLDNRESGSLVHHAASTLWRQTLNTELSPFPPPGNDDSFPGGVPRFHQVLGAATPTISWLFPKKWRQDEIGEWESYPYIVERATVLSRVWARNDLPYGEPIATIEIAKFVPPATRTWTLRAGIHTEAPTSLNLPPSSPDWYHEGLGSIPRYFASQHLMDPTAELEVLKISLIPRDVTLELGALWFSKSPNGRPLPWIENPSKNQLPKVDLKLFSDSNYQFVNFPERLHPEVPNPTRYFSEPDPEEDRPDPEFRFIEDPWVLAGDIPFELKIGNWEGKRRTQWHVLEESHPHLSVPLGADPIDRVSVAISLGPRPADWKRGAVAVLRCSHDGTPLAEKEIRPGIDLSFWREPYIPGHSLVWKETRGFFPPAVIYAVTIEIPDPVIGAQEVSISLTEEAKNCSADLAIMGITAHMNANHP